MHCAVTAECHFGFCAQHALTVILLLAVGPIYLVYRHKIDTYNEITHEQDEFAQKSFKILKAIRMNVTLRLQLQIAINDDLI